MHQGDDDQPGVGHPVPDDRSQTRLNGCGVLVVEDEYFLASDLAKALTSCGATVVGPEPTPDRAIARLKGDARIDVAILDINLRGEMVYELADRLIANGTPFLFLSGYDSGTPPPRFQAVPRMLKPSTAGKVVRALERLLTPDGAR